MAIQVSGTTVINNSRGLSNITSIDSTTTTALTNAGLGGGGAVSEYTVGSFAHGRGGTGDVSVGGTTSSFSSSALAHDFRDGSFDKTDSAGSGTWRAMTFVRSGYPSIYLRIA